MMVYCKKCRRELESDSEFCKFCGYRMDEESTDADEKAPKKKKTIIAVFAIAIILICLYVFNGDFMQQFKANSFATIGQVNNASEEDISKNFAADEMNYANGQDDLLKEGR